MGLDLFLFAFRRRGDPTSSDRGLRMARRILIGGFLADAAPPKNKKNCSKGRAVAINRPPLRGFVQIRNAYNGIGRAGLNQLFSKMFSKDVGSRECLKIYTTCKREITL